MGVQRFAKQPLDTETSITIQHHEAIARSNDRVCTSERLWNSSVRTSRNRPVPGLPRTAPKTAHIASDPSGPEHRPNLIMLLIAKPSESGRLPNRRIWPSDPASPDTPIRTVRRTLSKCFRRFTIFVFTSSSFRFRIYFFRCSDVRLHFSILVSRGSVRIF